MGHRVCIFWDNSNIFIGGQHICASKEGPLTDTRALRVHFENLYNVAVGGRGVEMAFCVGVFRRIRGFKVPLRGAFSEAWVGKRMLSGEEALAA